MSDWGSYLKNAVANVEQQLDRVLLEQNEQKNTTQPNPQPKPRSSRPDLAERLKRATNGPSKQATPETSTPEPPKSETTQSPSAETKESSKDSGDPEEADKDATNSDPQQPIGDSKVGEKPPPQDEPDLGEASERSSELPESKELIELITNTTFEIAPSLSDITLEARKLALSVQRDDALALVDHLEKVDEEMSAYVDSISTRFSSLHSKARLLGTTRADLAADSQQRQVALLMEEGQRLSQQELKLNMLVKKLRSERNAAVTKADSASSKLANLETQVANTNAELKLKSASVNELEGMVEHFRISAESANKMLDSQIQQGSGDSDGRDVTALVEERFNVEKSKWNIVEADLLARISELENQTDARSTQFTRLQHSLQEAQQVSRDSRDQMADLQDKLDETVEQHSIEDSRLQREVNELKLAQESLRSQLSATESRNTELETKLHLSQEQFKEQLKEQHEQLTNNVPFGFSEDITYDDIDPVTTVGPSGPFGEYADNYQHEDTRSMDADSGINSHDGLGEETKYPESPVKSKQLRSNEPSGEVASDVPEVPDISIEGGTTSLPSNLDLSSRRESSLVGQDSLLGSNLSLVKRLTLQVRKLENELSVTQKSFELAKVERDEFQAELEKMLDTQEQLNQSKMELNNVSSQTLQLNEKISELSTALNDKDERIDELEQDVRDLKEMYKEQVETLVNEIETIRRG